MIGRSTIAVLVTLALTCGTLAFQDQEKQQDDKIQVPSKGPEAVARRDFMMSKLRFSQMIFEGLTTGNLKLVQEGAQEVHAITKGSAWVTVDDERYQKLTSEFETATKRLIEAAESGNIDATALRYYHMSTSCDCHKHIRKVGYEF